MTFDVMRIPLMNIENSGMIQDIHRININALYDRNWTIQNTYCINNENLSISDRWIMTNKVEWAVCYILFWIISQLTYFQINYI